MAYTSIYDTQDITDLSIDFVGGLGVAFIAFVSLIALTALAVWGLRAYRRHK